MALSDAERQRNYRQRRAASGTQIKIKYRKPADRRSAPERWDNATADLLAILDDYQTWRDGMPPGVSESATAQKLDAMLELRNLVEELQAADPPKGFGRD
jgi:hypothetical protein